MRNALLAAFWIMAWVPGWSQTDPMNEKEALQIIKLMRANGQVGGSWDLRVTGTDKSYNYKLRATWLTPQVLQAAGRLLEISKGTPNPEVRRIMQAIDLEGAHYVLVELDPREGSGVIPREWLARFGPKGVEDRQVVGKVMPDQETWRKVLGVFPRDYSYDVFLVQFSVEAAPGIRVFQPADTDAELQVRIYNKSGRVRWPIPPHLLH